MFVWQTVEMIDDLMNCIPLSSSSHSCCILIFYYHATKATWSSQLTILFKCLFLSPTPIMHTCTKFYWLHHHKFCTSFDEIKPRCLEERTNSLVDGSRCFERLWKCTTLVTFPSFQKKNQTFICSITDGLRGTNRLTHRISALTPSVNGFLLRFVKKKNLFQDPITKTARANDYWSQSEVMPDILLHLRNWEISSKLSKLAYLHLIQQLNAHTPYTTV